MPAIAVFAGVALGLLAAYAWLAVAKYSDARPLFGALGRSMRALLSDEGNFLREYGVLLVHVGAFVLWNVLALAAAVAPMLLFAWLSWSYLADHYVLFLVVYSLASMAGIFWFKSRAKHAPDDAERGGLSVSDSQFLLLQVVESAPWLIRRGAALETRLLRRRIAERDIDRPVFIAGLARSGTTMLLEMLATADGVATHRYRDFPFLLTPYLWGRFVDLFGAKGTSSERPHQDGIEITPESPEAFEEPIWQLYFPNAHRQATSHVLSAADRNEDFDEVFRDHLRKMLLIRRGERYVSKGNYNLTRIEYLAALFPDARFVVPIRHPLTHVTSLVRQHELFCRYSEHDRRVPQYLMAAGHFEFGPQRVPISVNGSGVPTLAAWNEGNEHAGYAMQWAAVYGYVFELLERSPALAQRVRIVRFEDLCDAPRDEMLKILQHADLEREGAGILERLGHVKAASPPRAADATNTAVWQITESVAIRFGYEPLGRDESWSAEALAADSRG